ncbi:neural Wiskott-Aldrich syndrome protein [Diaphorina citri]|uniref:Neural Wiskott-Aldrich syndrome protein n=1 Tax=Diaphorina citri TaxID=121845 RepID=A0A1S4EFJ0_DIACI|nr:neural Wiskott-Aldrich syndrome protein [Diaphorina citri]
MPTNAPPEQKTSSLLTRQENEAVFKLLGNRCQALSTTVIQLFTTDGPNDNEWHKRCFGILCLVKDNPRKSYFFRLYCLTRKQLLWEHELYTGMDYMAPQNFLHIFEAEDCVVAFNFASEEEARHMRYVILEKQKRIERRHRASTQPRHATPGADRERSRTLQPAVPINQSRSGDRRRDGKKNKLTKADISSPTEFRHVSHVGFDPNRGFDAVDIQNSPELEMFFEKAGVSQSQLQDRKTREFIYDFISRNGGLDAAKEEAHLPPPPFVICVSSQPVDPDSKKSTLTNDSRGELLDQIRQGVELKAVQPVSKPAVSTPSDGLAGALARALAERSRVIHSDSDDTSDTDEENEDENDEDEWED